MSRICLPRTKFMHIQCVDFNNNNHKKMKISIENI